VSVSVSVSVSHYKMVSYSCALPSSLLLYCVCYCSLQPAETMEPPHAPHAVKMVGAKSELALEQYKQKHKESIENPEAFWGKQAKEQLDWFRPFDSVLQGSFEHGDIRWFSGGVLNLTYNALDRHIPSKGDQVAIVWEGDEPNDIRRITYKELLRKVCQIANALLRMGVQKGDVVTIYMP
jgi:hypothetical protein